MNATAKTTAHANCSHAATKADRAKCRAAAKKIAAHNADIRAEIRAAYFDGVETEELLGMMAKAGIYADPDLDIEELIAAL